MRWISSFSPAQLVAVAVCLLLARRILSIPDQEADQSAQAGGRTAHVRFVIDGDTLVLTDGERVRLLGIDAPELGKDGDERAEDGATEARRGLQQLLSGNTVRLRPGLTPRDRYGRLLAWVETSDGVCASEWLLRNGLARHELRFPLPESHEHRLRAAEAEARVRKTGIWAH